MQRKCLSINMLAAVQLCHSIINDDVNDYQLETLNYEEICMQHLFFS
jgi:hypothetical protein